MRNKPCVWHFLLRIQLILGSALVLSVPAQAGEMTNAKEPASAARTAPEFKIAQSQKIETAQEVGPTDDTSNLGNSSELDASDDPMGQVTNVSQLQDVQPTDWAYEALRNLVERYGCIAGYPDGSFRGNRAMSRYEFAAGLNACLQQIERLIATSGGTDRVTREDLATLQRLNNEFVTELATLRTRLNNLDTRVTQLEGLQFSTTTRLNGEAIIAAYDAFSGEAPAIEFFNSTFGGIRDPNGQFINIDPKGEREFDSNTALGSRVRLNLDTSFSGRDLLRTGLQVLNSTALSTVTNTPQTDFDFNPGPFRNSSANVELDTLYYRLPLGNRSQAIVAASARLTDIADPVNPYFNSAGLGAVSRFGQFNPIYRLGAGAGVGFKFKLNDAIGVDLGYLGGGRSYTSPMATGNVFGGPYGAIAQLNFTPGNRFRAALTYVHSYNFDPEVGSNLSNPRTTLTNFSRLVDRASLTGSLSPFLIEQILRFLESNGISRNAFLARQLILRLPLSNDLKNQLLTQPGSELPATTVAEILAGAIQQDITSTANQVVSGLNPAQQQQLVQQLQAAGFNVTAANADQIARIVSQQIVAQGGLTPAQEALVRTRFGEQAINDLRDFGVTTVTQTQPSQIAENFANTQTLARVFPDANLPPALGTQTLRTALNNAGYTDRAGNLTFNDLLNLRLFNVPGASTLANQNPPVTVRLDGGSVNASRAVQLSDGTLGSISLLDILDSSNNLTDPSTAARLAEFRQQFPGTLEAINLSRLFGVFNTDPIATQPVNNITTQQLVRALVDTTLVSPLAQDLINLAEQPDFPIVSNSYGLQFSYQVSRGFAIGGWVGYTNNRLLRDIPLTSALQQLDPTIGNLPTRGDTQAINGAINLAFPDLGKRGNLAGIIFGVQPITYQGVLGFDQGPGFHIEGLYRYQVSDNISVTPGVVWLTRPDHNLDAKDIVIGTIRTTFTF